MRPLQRMIGTNGYEVMLFPLQSVYVTQGENGSYSHQGILAMDLIEMVNNVRVFRAPMYAPCTCTCVATISGSENGRVFQSDYMVNTPNGLDYVTFMCFHDNNPIASVGSHFVQGQIFAHTGTAGNVTGDHTHFNTAFGQYAGWIHVPPENHGELANSSHIYETCYVNDTQIKSSGGYNWVEYQGGITPTQYKRKNFPWVLYSNKLRNK